MAKILGLVAFIDQILWKCIDSISIRKYNRINTQIYFQGEHCILWVVNATQLGLGDAEKVLYHKQWMRGGIFLQRRDDGKVLNLHGNNFKIIT